MAWLRMAWLPVQDFLRNRAKLAPENLAVRQQVGWQHDALVSRTVQYRREIGVRTRTSVRTVRRRRRPGPRAETLSISGLDGDRPRVDLRPEPAALAAPLSANPSQVVISRTGGTYGARERDTEPCRFSVACPVEADAEGGTRAT